MLSEVTGGPLDKVSAETRHVREMWEASSTDTAMFRRVKELEIGNLLITRRRYHINDMAVAIPGHTGIITRLDPMHFIHASAESGLVEERPLYTTATILGGIAVHL